MARGRLRGREEILERVGGLSATVAAGLARLPHEPTEPRVIDAIWQGEGLGTLLWALSLVEPHDYDEPYEPEWLVATPVETAAFRPRTEIDDARETARLWHWRVRTDALVAAGRIEPPEPWQSFEQLIATTAVSANEEGLLPPPLRGDFPVLGVGYRDLTSEQKAEIGSIAYERHRALNWLCGEGSSWEETPTDT